jgi:hypothetical protein
VSVSFGSSSPHVIWRCRGAVEPSIDLAALDEISVETRGRAEGKNGTPYQKLFPWFSSPHNAPLQI